MVKTMSRLRPEAPPVNGSGELPSLDRVSLSSPTRRRPSWMLLGALLVAVAALLGAWVLAASTDQMSVMVAARELDPGEVVSASDLRVVEMGRSSELRAVQPSQQDLIVGRAARGPIPAGTVLNTDLFALKGETIPAGMVVVGVSLEPGAVPVASLRAGDRVDVLGVQETTSSGSLDAGTAAPVAVILATGPVWAVEPVGAGTSTSGVWVSVVVPADSQGRVAQAAADGLLRLSLRGAGE